MGINIRNKNSLIVISIILILSCILVFGVFYIINNKVKNDYDVQAVTTNLEDEDIINIADLEEFEENDDEIIEMVINKGNDIRKIIHCKRYEKREYKAGRKKTSSG